MKKRMLFFALLAISSRAMEIQKPERFEVSCYSDGYAVQNNVQKLSSNEIAQFTLNVENGRTLSVFWSSMDKVNKELFVKVKTLYKDSAWITCQIKDKVSSPLVEVSSPQIVLFDGSETVFDFRNPLYEHNKDEGRYLHVIIKAYIPIVKS